METFESVEAHVDDLEEIMETELKIIENSLIKGRDRGLDHLPLYSTKWRIKRPGSVFLKMRRKGKNLDDIFDYGGMRALCLFEQDIPQVHKYLLSIFHINNYILKEITIFNWPEDEYEEFNIELLRYTTESFYKNMTHIHEKKMSGYKSIHYIINFNRSGTIYPLEIQLRTIFQDAWGELEHSLSYKQGNIHPHIRECFSILANDIESADNLMNHLKEIHDNEKFREFYAIESAGPFKYLDYKMDTLPKLFEKEPYQKLFHEYNKYISMNASERENKEWISRAQDLLRQLSETLPHSIYEHNKEVKYFIDMENAYIIFSDGRFSEALEAYRRICKEFPGHYVPLFRMGEILFIQDKTHEAISAFDKTESLMLNKTDDNYNNRYKIKSKISHVYWLLGPQYIDMALQKINETKSIVYSAPEGVFSKIILNRLLNNVAYYRLEKYLWSEPADKDQCCNDFFEAFNELVKCIDKNKVELSSNIHDTLAWSYYHIYQKTKDREILRLAKLNCRKITEKQNSATFKITSQNIQMNHFLEIMRAK